MPLTDDELRDVLARAEEIERASRHGNAWNAEVAAVIGAAEEVGLSRAAVERALTERLDLPAAPPEVGALTWAKSADGKFYVAEVLAMHEDGAHVRFARGSEHRVMLDQLRRCSFLPGERLVCNWPWWGPWSCSVVAYDARKRRVKVDDGWGSTTTVSISEVWLAPAKAERRAVRTRVYATLVGVGATVGAVIGSIITAIILR